jgi:hypothetical protein
MRVVANFLRRPRFVSGQLFRSQHLRPGYLKKGFRCLFYLDDILVLSQPGAARYYSAAFVEIVSCFGLILHPSKSDLSPKPRRCHLGLDIDTTERYFRVPAHKHVALTAHAGALLTFAAQHRRWVSKHLLASFCGSAISLAPAIPAGRFHLLPLYDSIGRDPSWAPRTMVRLTNAAYRQLRDFWRHLPLPACRVSWDLSAPEELLFTDSSDWAWGAHVGTSHFRSGAFSPADAAQHITFKELKAIALALEIMGPLLTVKNIAIFSDSSTAV